MFQRLAVTRNPARRGAHRTPPALSSHALIEFGNRAISGVVEVMTGVAAVLAYTRRPFRRDLASQ